MDTFGRPLFCLPQIPITGEDVEKLKLSYSVGGNINLDVECECVLPCYFSFAYILRTLCV